MIEHVAQGTTGQRLDAWLAALYPEIQRTHLRKWIEAGNVTLRGRVCAKGDRVEEGATYTLRTLPEAPQLRANPELPLNLLQDSEGLLAFSKPAGMDCQPNGAEETETLANALLARFPEVQGVGDGPLTCGLLHRIDRETSGLVLVARTQAIYEALRQQFRDHAIEKHYQALVLGHVSREGHLEHLLAHNPRCPGRIVDASQWHDAKRAMKAVTDYRPLRRLRLGDLPVTLLDVTIFTGVTHQIRAQLSFAGLPIVGDQRYGGPMVPNFSRHFLHAFSADFVHPVSHAHLHWEAPLTQDLTDLLRRAK